MRKVFQNYEKMLENYEVLKEIVKKCLEVLHELQVKFWTYFNENLWILGQIIVNIQIVGEMMNFWRYFGENFI